MTDRIPAVGETVRYDGADHPITAVHEKTVDFANGDQHSSVARFDLAPGEQPGTWGVVGRTEKRPANQKLGVQVTPAVEATDG